MTVQHNEQRYEKVNGKGEREEATPFAECSTDRATEKKHRGAIGGIMLNTSAVGDVFI